MPSHAAAPDHHLTNQEETMTQPNHPYVRPGQVAQDRPAPDRCMQCGQPGTVHTAPPLETERQARELPAVRAVYDAMHAHTGRIDAAHRERIEAMCSGMITDACKAAGVEMGAYDQRIVSWLGNWEPQTCAVIAGLITRARAAGSTQ
jgi:hypothetical protein